jgi:hypothetical protein
MSMEFAAIYGPAHDFLRRHVGKDVLIVAMERSAADHVVRKYGGSHCGIHRYSLRQLVTALASTVLAKRGWRPITLLSAEALAAQVIDRTKLTYFAPVARTPGFPGALVETITRTRLQGQALPAGDLSVLSASSRRENIVFPVYRRSSWIFGRITTWSAPSWRHCRRRPRLSNLSVLAWQRSRVHELHCKPFSINCSKKTSRPPWKREASRFFPRRVKRSNPSKSHGAF